MIIQAEKSYATRALMYSVIMLAAAILSTWQGKAWIGIPIAVPCIVFLVRNYVAVGRKITIDQQGCEISLGKYSRKYLWSQFNIQRAEPRYEYARLPLIFRFPTYENGGAFFSIKNVNKPLRTNCVIFATFYCPWSSFFVSFVDKDQQSTFGNIEGIYEVDKEEFLAKMKAWGLKVENNE